MDVLDRFEERMAAKETSDVVSEIVYEGSIPKPVGYRVLIAMPDVKETYGDSGIIKAGKTIRDESILSMIGVVIDMGESAYKDKERFPDGPWCKVGDYVLFRGASGTRFRVSGKEFRMLNDDSIEAVVEDPSELTNI